jgi:Tfp pilus assembly protein PilZ
MTAFDKELNESSVANTLGLISNICDDGQETESKEVDVRLPKGKGGLYRKPLFMVIDHATKDHTFWDIIQNISSGGVFIEIPMPFTVGQELSLAFVPPKYQKYIKITGEVIRVSPKRIGAKLEMVKYQQETTNRKELSERRKDKGFQL